MRYGGKVCRFTESEKSQACVYAAQKIRKIAYENSLVCVFISIMKL